MPDPQGLKSLTYSYLGDWIRTQEFEAKAGKSGAAPITHFDATLFKTRFACEVKGFDPTKFMDRKESRKLDPSTQYALVAADEAAGFTAASAIDGAKAAAKHKTQIRSDKPVIRLFLFLFP